MRETLSKVPQSKVDICTTCDQIKDLLLEKNEKYGDSALNPCRIFSKADAVESILVRIDDKLSRIRNQSPNEDEDAVMDLIGYLVLLKVAQMQQHRNEKQSEIENVP